MKKILKKQIAKIFLLLFIGLSVLAIGNTESSAATYYIRQYINYISGKQVYFFNSVGSLYKGNIAYCLDHSKSGPYLGESGTKYTETDYTEITKEQMQNLLSVGYPTMDLNTFRSLSGISLSGENEYRRATQQAIWKRTGQAKSNDSPNSRVTNAMNWIISNGISRSVKIDVSGAKKNPPTALTPINTDIIYGPYSVKSTGLINGNINVSVNGNATLLNSNKTSLGSNAQFYNNSQFYVKVNSGTSDGNFNITAKINYNYPEVIYLTPIEGKANWKTNVDLLRIQRMALVVPKTASSTVTKQETYQTAKKIEIEKVDGDNNSIKIAGVSFKVVNTATGVSYTMITNNNGIAVLDNLPTGTYKITETYAPGNYELNDQIVTISLKNNASTSSSYIGDILVEETSQKTKLTVPDVNKTKLTIKKYDSENDSGIAGMKFYFWKADESKPSVANKVTKSNGSIAENLRDGIYYLEEDAECALSKGFKPVYGVIKLEVRSGTIKSVDTLPDGISINDNTISFPNMPLKGKIKIEKTDSVTGSYKGTYRNMQGISFKITNKETGEVVGTYSTSLKSNKAITNDITLKVGTYIISEITTLNNYIKCNDIEIEVKLKEGSTSETEVLIKSEDDLVTAGEITNNVLTINVANEPYGNLIIVKKNMYNENILLPGAVFEIYDSSNKIVSIDGKTQFTTGEDGEISVIIPAGIYTVKEVKLPTDYEFVPGTTGEYVVEVLPGKAKVKYNSVESEKMVVYNKPTQKSVIIIKKDTEGNPVEGVTFKVYNVFNSYPGEYVGEYTTDSEGKIYLQLKYEKYRLEEVSSPIGYMTYDYSLNYCLAEKFAQSLGIDTTSTNNQYTQEYIEFFEGFDSTFTYDELVAFLITKTGISYGDTVAYNQYIDNLSNLKKQLFAELANGYTNGNVIIDVEKISEGIEFELAATAEISNAILEEIELKIVKQEKDTNKEIPAAEFILVYKNETGDSAKDYYDIGSTDENGELILNFPEYNRWLKTMQGKVTEDTNLDYLKKYYELYEVNAPGYVLPGEEVEITGTNKKGVLVAEIQIDYEEEVNVYYNSKIDEVVSIESNGQGIELTIENEKQTVVGNLIVEKCDKENPNTTNDLSSTFRLEYANGQRAKDKDGNEIADIIIGSDGKMQGVEKVENLPLGKYYLKEVKAPVGYKKLEEAICVEITENSNNNTTLVRVENSEISKLKIIKLDENSQNISGAKFKITRLDEETGEEKEVIYESVEIKTNEPLILPIALGLYKIEEIEAPVGYKKALTEQCIFVENEGELLEVEFVNEKDYKVGKLIIKKKVANYEPTTYLEGAKFTIQKQETEGLVEAKDINGGYIGQIETINGEAKRVITTNSLGTITIEELPLGEYEITEVYAPEGYKLDTTPQRIIIEKEENEETYELLFEDEFKYTLQINKKITGTDVPLADVTFELYNEDGTKAYDILGNIIESVTTNEEGKAEIARLRPGNYILKESNVPAGYGKLDISEEQEITYNIEIKEETTVKNIENDILYGSLKIQKLSKADENDASYVSVPLSGAKFEIYKITENEVQIEEEGTKIIETEELVTEDVFGNEIGENGVITTNEEGIIIINNLLQGKYVIKEIEAPVGYTIVEEESKKEVTIIANQEIMQILYNREDRCNLTINKYEESEMGGNKVYIPEVTFKLQELDKDEKVVKEITKVNVDKDGTQSGETITTNAEGKVTITGLKCNTVYRIVEESAPDRYIIPSEEDSITYITEGDLEQSINITNTAQSGNVKIEKYEEKVNNLIEGSIFIVVPINANPEEVQEIVDNAVATLDGTIDYEGNYPTNDITWFTSRRTDNPSSATNPNDIRVISLLNNGVEEINISTGTYLIKEIRAPELYYLSDDVIEFTVKSAKDLNKEIGYEHIENDNLKMSIEDGGDEGAYSLYTFKFENTRKLGLAKLVKIDSKGNRLNNVTFKLYRDFNENKKIDDFEKDIPTYTVTTGSDIMLDDGEAIIRDIPIGQYIVTETETPAGYYVSNKYILKVNENIEDNVLYELDDETETPIDNIVNTFLEIPVQIIKIDKDTKEKLQGVKFDIYGSKLEDEKSVIDYSNKIKTVVTDQNGIADIGKLQYGVYFAVEIETLEGYALQETPIKLDLAITPDGEAIKNTLPSEDYIAQFTVKNSLDIGSIVVYKYEETTEGKKYLEGAKFEVYKAEKDTNNNYILDETTKVGELDYKEIGEGLKEEYKTYEIQGMPKGEYVIVEVEAPEGYILDSIPVPVTVEGIETEGENLVNSLAEVNIVNQKSIGILELEKVREDNQEKVSGVTFEIYKDENKNGKIDTEETALETVVTDAEGKIEVELIEGLYILKETQAPAGYIISEQEYIFKIAKSESVSNKAKTTKVYKLEEGKEAQIAEEVNKGTYQVEGISKLENEFIKVPVKIKKTNEDGSELLKGAEFTLYGSKLQGTEYVIDYEKVIDVKTTNENGIADFGKIYYGVYFIAETKAPENYYTERKSIKIDLTVTSDGLPIINELPTSNYAIEITVKNSLDIGSIVVYKYEETTEGKKYLEGAKFEVYKAEKDTNNNYILDETTKVGELDYKEIGEGLKEEYKTYEIQGMPKGEYVIVEVEAPEGYILDSTPVPVTVEGIETEGENLVNSLAEVNIVNQKSIGILELEKVREDNQEKVSGVTFEIYKDGNKNGKIDTEETALETVVTDAEGKIEVELIEGLYILKETQAPAGYIISEQEYIFKIAKSESVSNKAKTTKVYKLEEGKEAQIAEEVNKGTYQVEGISKLENEFIKVPVKIKKTNEDGSKLLKGAEFTLYGSKLQGTEYVIDYEKVIDVKTTNENGIADFGKIYYGVYFIAETKAPENYYTERKSIKIDLTVTSDGLPIINELPTSNYAIEITVKNSLDIGSIVVYKYEETTEGKKYLEGAKFEVYKAEKDTNNNYILDETTKVGELDYKEIGEGLKEEYKTYEIQGMPKGEYVIVEVEAPEGYILDSTPVPVTVEGIETEGENLVNSLAEVNIVNQKSIGILELEKVREDNQEKVSGVTFEIYKDGNKNGKIDTEETALETVVTDAEGKIEVELIEGLYILKETQAPAGYIISEQEYIFKIAKSESVSNKAKTTKVYKLEEGKEAQIAEEVNKGTYQVEGISKLENEFIKVPVKIKKTNEDGSKLLKGAEFTLYGSKLQGTEYVIDYEKVIDVKTTNENGIADFGKIYYGVYFIAETKAPNTYYLDSKPIKVDLTVDSNGKIIENELPEVNFKKEYVMTNIVNGGALIVTKLEEGADTKLSGAIFEIYEAQKDEAGNYIKEDDKYVYNTELEGILLKDNGDGTYSIDNLPKGQYAILETQAPKGYILSTSLHEIEIKGATVDVETQEIIQSKQEVMLENSKGRLCIQKIQEGTNINLAGIEFTIYKQEDLNGIIDDNEKINPIVVATKEDGYIDATLDEGLYIMKETKTIKGYELSDKEYIFKIDEDNKVATSVYELNERATIAEKANNHTIEASEKIEKITNKLIDVEVKIDKLNLSEEHLEGAKFKIYKAKQDDITGEYVKDEEGNYILADVVIEETELSSSTGIVHLGKLPYGIYLAEEIVVPDGYIRAKEIEVIDLTQYTEEQLKQGITRNIYNLLDEGSITIVKKEGAYGDENTLVSGAEFKIYKCQTAEGTYAKDVNGNYQYSENELVATTTETSTGYYSCQDLTIGKYVLVETKVPDGYKAIEPIGFEITKMNDLIKIVIDVDNATEEDKITIKDDLLVGKINIIKKSEANEIVPEVTFRIKTKDKSTVGKYIDVIRTTGQNGEITIEDLPVGIYEITEEEVPYGYYLDKKPQVVEVKANETAKVTFTNKIQTHNIKIIKKDQYNEAITNPAIFELYRDENRNGIAEQQELVTRNALGKEIGEIKTNSQGEVIIENLQSTIEEGGIQYIIKEIQPPQGYIDDEKQEIIILQHESQDLEDKVTNTVECKIINRKIVFDLGLEKWVSKVTEGKENYAYQARNTLDAEVEGRQGDIFVKKGDIVTYTIRIFNHGNIDGYATKIIDNIPYGLEFIEPTFDENNEPTNTNAIYGWLLNKESGQVYTETLKDIAIQHHTQTDCDTAHKGLNYNVEGGETCPACDNCYYMDVKIAFRVTDAEKTDKIINIAQIAETKTDYDTEDYKIQDIDSTPNNYGEIYDETSSREDDEDIAVIIPYKFNLELAKWITSYQVIEKGKAQEYVTDQDSTTTEEEKYNEKLVKVDINGNKIENTEVIVNYGIRITNMGELPGYVKQVTDYIPSGTRFVPEDNVDKNGNPYWVLDGDQAVTSTGYEELFNTLLQPKEYIDINIKLRLSITEDNVDIGDNIAEISKDYNEWNVKDYNSTVGNLKYGEDDIDRVPVLVTIKTGEYMIKYFVIVGALTMILVGAIVVKKRLKARI